MTASEILAQAGLGYALVSEGWHADVEAALRRLAEIMAENGVDALTRESVRTQAIDILKAGKVQSAARLIDAAIGRPESQTEPSGQGSNILLREPDPWPEPVDGGELLDGIVHHVKRYLILPSGAAEAMALWTLHTYALDAADMSAILALTSAEKRCGKTHGLEVLQALVWRPLPAANVTPPALFRTIEQYSPTLLIDEMDTFLNQSDELRGILNSGHRRASAQLIRCVGEDHEPRVFRTWCGKAVALIGDLPGTLTDRAIIIRMQRKLASERVERLRYERLIRELDPIRRQAVRWVQDAPLTDCRIEDLPELNDRENDNWRALFAVADAAGGDWPERARQAARILSGAQTEPDSSAGVQLLGDLRDLYREPGTDRLTSVEIVTALGAMEERPWPEWRQGRPITTRQLARALAPFGVKPKQIRFGTCSVKGYYLSDFEDSFSRYTSFEPKHPKQSSNDEGFSAISETKQDLNVSDRKSAAKPHEQRNVSDVSDEKGGSEEKTEKKLFEDRF